MRPSPCIRATIDKLSASLLRPNEESNGRIPGQETIHALEFRAEFRDPFRGEQKNSQTLNKRLNNLVFLRVIALLHSNLRLALTPVIEPSNNISGLAFCESHFRCVTLC